MVTKRPFFSWALHGNRGLQIALGFLVLLTIFFRVFPLEMQKRIVNIAIAMKSMDALLLYCGLYLGAVVLAGALKYLINMLQGFIGQRVLLDMRRQLYDQILKLPLSFYRRTPPGMVITSLTSELSAIGDFMGGAIATPAINILTLAGFAVYLAWLNPLLALLSFAIFPAEILIVPFLQKKFNLLNRTRIDVTRTMSNIIGEAVSGMHDVHGNAGYGIERAKLAGPSEQLFGIRNRMNGVRFLTKFINNFFQSLGPFVLFLVGGWLTINGRFDLGALVAFLSAYEKFYDPWKELLDYYQDLQDSRVRYHQIMDYFDEPLEMAVFPEDEGRAPVSLEGGISVRGVSYVAGGGRTTILDQVTFEIEPGGQMAVVGASGSGKSTLAMVLGQLYGYSGGHVLMDGHELKSLTKLDISHNIGYVAQAPFIFDGTLLENLLYAARALAGGADEQGPEEPGRDEVMRVIEEVGLHEDVLGIGLNTLLRPGEHENLAAELVRLRGLFYERYGKAFSNRIDFFDAAKYQDQATIWENIIFGYPSNEPNARGRIPEAPFFFKFLEKADLVRPLGAFGEQIARQTVLL